MAFKQDILIRQVTEAISNAKKGKSLFADFDYSKFNGWVGSSKMSRDMFSNLCNLDGASYLECGLYGGSTFIGSIFKNPLKACYGIDSWALGFNGEDGKTVEENFKKNLAMVVKQSTKPNIFKADCFKFDLAQIKDKIDIYFYDAGHTADEQKKGIVYYYPTLADRFILVVDDWNWSCVREGTMEAIKEMELSILFQHELPELNKLDTECVSTPYGRAKLISNKDGIIKVQHDDGNVAEYESRLCSCSRAWPDVNGWWNGFFLGVLEKKK
jgi:hypothetical protein